jgi:hypothetical protein
MSVSCWEYEPGTARSDFGVEESALEFSGEGSGEFGDGDEIDGDFVGGEAIATERGKGRRIELGVGSKDDEGDRPGSKLGIRDTDDAGIL